MIQDQKFDRENSVYLNSDQKELVRAWLASGISITDTVKKAASVGFYVTEQNIKMNYSPSLVKREAEYRLDHPVTAIGAWAERDYRVEKLCDIAQQQYEDIKGRKYFDVEVTETNDKFGGKTTTKPVYFPGVIKNFNDTLDGIAKELGHRKNVTDININQQTKEIHVLLDKVWNQAQETKVITDGAEIIDENGLPAPKEQIDLTEFEESLDEDDE